jgi:hypothetical protein
MRIPQPMRIASRPPKTLSSGVNFFRTLFLASLVVALSACVAPFRDDSHYVSVSPTDGYYLLQKGSPLALQLGYANPPTSSNDDRLHAGSYVDAVAFRFDSAGLLSAPPGYFAEFTPDSMAIQSMTRLKQGVSTWPEVRAMFDGPNRCIKQPDGGMLVYHEIPKSS